MDDHNMYWIYFLLFKNKTLQIFQYVPDWKRVFFLADDKLFQ